MRQTMTAWSAIIASFRFERSLYSREGGQPSRPVRFATASMEASIAMPTETPEPMPLEFTETPKATALESAEAMAFELSKASKAA